MQEKFQCSKCKKIFTAIGKKVEINNHIYGKGWKWIAECECGFQAEQYQPKKEKKKAKKKPACAGNCSTCPYQ